MFKQVEKTGLNQISLTGLRALVCIGLLIVKPRSFEELKQILIDLKIMDEHNSDDILRIDLNTIKLMGCEIQRCAPKTNFKYVLTKHPFSLNIPKNEILVLKRAYNIIKKDANLNQIIRYHELFNKISEYIFDEEIKEILLGISVLKYYDIELVKELWIDCKFKRNLILTYQKPNSNKEVILNIIGQELVYKNDKFYIYGYDLNKKRSTVLNIRRLINILYKKNNSEDIEIEQTKIKFLFKSKDIDLLEENEKIIEETPEGYLVEAIYHNDFLAMQRVLSFGIKCIVLEPFEFRQNVIKKIKEMRDIYVR